MVTDELVELAQSVASVWVQAAALGQKSVASTLEMALDELLARLADELEAVALLNAELEEGQVL